MTLALAEIPKGVSMVERFTTESGSVYEINDTAMTWTRINKTARSGGIRSETGVFDNRTPVVVGKRFGMLCPPFDETWSGSPRMIVTSTVIALGGVQ